MRLYNLSKQFIKDPAEFWLKILCRISPSFLWHRYSNLCQKRGIKKPKFILSFDCDTDKDIEVVWDVHCRLMALGIMPVYAVPGALLERGAAVYKKIAATGAEFINHGYAEHTILKEQQYISTIFYDQLTLKEVEQDILQGHETIQKVLNLKPEGFRTPHFGTFASRDNFKFLYRVLESLKYKYSTSSLPIHAFKYGTLFRKHGVAIREVPLTGFFDFPFLLLDSWGLRYSENNQWHPTIYKDQIKKYLSFIERKPMVINLYADPSQVYDWEDFFEAMKMLAPYNITSYANLLKEAINNG